MHATTSPKAIDLKPALMAVLGATLLTAGVIIGSAIDLKIAPTTASVAAPDTSYDSVEGARAQFGVTPDTSYDSVEAIRQQFGVTPDTSYDTVEGIRVQSGVTVDRAESGFPSSRGSGTNGVSQHDQLRGSAGWWATAPVAPATEVEPFDRIGGGYR